MQPLPSSEREKNQIISFLRLRTAIGALGISLPFLLVLTDSVAKCRLGIEFSISDYYDNYVAGDLLVGVLFVLGFFLWSYRGYEPIDNRASNFGFICAMGVALFPTTSGILLVHRLHFVFAFFLFATFIFFSLYLFRKKSKDPNALVSRQKKNRNKVYLICGIIMIVCIIVIALGSFGLFGEVTGNYKLVFWFETIALIAFGFSWITKGELLWADVNNSGSPEKK
jgi:Ca2+/Na+ antiporter